MDDFTDLMEKALLGMERDTDGPPLVAKVIRTGILPEKIYLFYSQDRLAAYGLRPESLQNILSARNITMVGGQMDLTRKSVAISVEAVPIQGFKCGGIETGGRKRFRRALGKRRLDRRGVPFELGQLDGGPFEQRHREPILRIGMAAGKAWAAVPEYYGDQLIHASILSQSSENPHKRSST